MTTTRVATDAAIARAIDQVPLGLLIDGEFVPAVDGRSIDTYDPATGRAIKKVAMGSEADVDLAVKAARAAFEGAWGRMTPDERGRCLWRLADLVEQNRESLALLETLDNGKPFAGSLGDVAETAQVLRYYAGWATKIGGRTIDISRPGPWHAYTIRQPVGVVGQIVPWNFPLIMTSWKIGPALAAGNTVVLKPAEQTPLTALVLGKLALDAGFPPGVLNVVNGTGLDAGAPLSSHPDVDKVAFTGSTATGKAIVGAALGNMKRVSLELGGKSPNVVFADADLDEAIEGSAFGIFVNQGEVCTAASRLFVQESVFDRVIAGVAKVAERHKLGSGLDSDTTMGPLVSEQQRTRVERLVDQGIGEGVEVVTGGSRPDSNGFFYKPTVLVTEGSQPTVVSREEIFGPVVVATSFTDQDDLIAKANDSQYGLAAGIWTTNLSTAHTTAARLHAGTVYVNSYHSGDAALPFGGFKQSGWGRELGEEGLALYTETKSVSMKL
jgi:phenylacetaldehyde dehydrogenase